MFRDLKEYQEIAKIYAEKVSKPENLEERVRGGGMKTSGVPAPKPVTVPQKGAGGGSGNPTNTRGTGTGAVKFEKPQGSAQGRTRRPEIKKPLPTTAEIRAKDKAAGGTGMSNIPKAEGSAVIDGKKLNPDFGKKVDIKKEFPDKVDPKPLTKKEKFDKKFIRDPKTKTLKRRGSPTAQRAENQEKAKLRAQAMAKARIEAKKKAEMAKEEFTPYDIVLEYLLSTEQAATIEEANYVMTEMDAETIQDIVEMDRMGGPAAVGAILGAGAVLAKPVVDAVKSVTNLGKKMRKKSEEQMNPKK